MRDVAFKVYNFSELSEAAQEKALNESRYVVVEGDWWHKELAERFKNEILPCFGVHANEVNYSGPGHQGDGARFLGRFAYEKGMCKKVAQFEDAELSRIATELMDVQRRHFYQLMGVISPNYYMGNYLHEMTTTFDIYFDGRDRYPSDEVEDTLKDLHRDLMRWFYKQFENEFWHQCSDEVVQDFLVANELEFRQDGTSY